MYKLEENKIIGQYLSKLISGKFDKQSDFCRAYLDCEGIEINEQEMKRIKNRISQILIGNKSIQLYDLPIFTELLDVTCEEIISAGKKFVPRDNRLTNYKVALSKNEKIWEEYINNDDNPILYPDEYAKTALDYAIQFKNIKFIQHLFKKGYIWFDNGLKFGIEDIDELTNKTSSNYWYEYSNNINGCKFEAGTNINKENKKNFDCFLPVEIHSIKLRMDLIKLSVENSNLDILKELNARDIPTYRKIIEWTLRSIEIEEIDEYCDQELIENIALSSREVIDYFTDTFVVNCLNKKHIFMYPFISKLLENLIKNENEFVKNPIKKSIDHNNNAYSELKALIKKIVETNAVRHDFTTDEYYNELRKCCTKKILEKIYFDKDRGIIDLLGYENVDGKEYPVKFTTNIVRVENESNDIEINYLIKELNDSYNKIVNIADEYEL